MLLAHGFLDDGQRLFEIRPGRRVIPLSMEQSAQVIERFAVAGCCSPRTFLRMARACSIRARAAANSLCAPQQSAQVVERYRRDGMLLARHFLANGQCLFKQRPGRRVIPLNGQQGPQVVERGRRVEMLFAQNLAPYFQCLPAQRYGSCRFALPEEFDHLRAELVGFGEQVVVLRLLGCCLVDGQDIRTLLTIDTCSNDAKHLSLRGSDDDAAIEPTPAGVIAGQFLARQTFQPQKGFECVARQLDLVMNAFKQLDFIDMARAFWVNPVARILSGQFALDLCFLVAVDGQFLGLHDERALIIPRLLLPLPQGGQQCEAQQQGHAQHTTQQRIGHGAYSAQEPDSVMERL